MSPVRGHGGARPSTPDRGQTGVDFLVGIGVFLLTVGFVVAFVPGILAPFSDDQELPLVADRAADTVVGDLLAGPEPSVLDVACTLEFFGVGSGGGCSLVPDPSGDGLATELGLSSTGGGRYNTQYHVRVSLEPNVPDDPDRGVLCGTDAPSVHTCGAGTRLEIGPRVPTSTDSVVTATRVVYVDGQDAILVVRVW